MTAPAQQALQLLAELDASARIGHEDYVRLRDVLTAPAPADAVRRTRRARPRCEACGHSIGSHNDLGYCTTGAGTPRSCDCDSYDDGLRRQPDGTLARPSATAVIP